MEALRISGFLESPGPDVGIHWPSLAMDTEMFIDGDPTAAHSSNR